MNIGLRKGTTTPSHTTGRAVRSNLWGILVIVIHFDDVLSDTGRKNDQGNTGHEERTKRTARESQTVRSLSISHPKGRGKLLGNQYPTPIL